MYGKSLFDRWKAVYEFKKIDGFMCCVLDKITKLEKVIDQIK